MSLLPLEDSRLLEEDTGSQNHSRNTSKAAVLNIEIEKGTRTTSTSNASTLTIFAPLPKILKNKKIVDEGDGEIMLAIRKKKRKVV